MNNNDNNHNNIKRVLGYKETDHHIIIIKVKGTACKLNKEMNKINNK